MSTYRPDPMDWTMYDWASGTTKGKTDPNPGKRAKTASRVVFIPWKAAEDEEWTAKTQDWIDVNARDKGKAIQMVHWDPDNQPNAILTALTAQADAVVYIRGHGSPSSTIIGNRHQQGNETVEEKLPITEACQRLIDSGLDPTFCGTIKFYSCYSATKIVDVTGENGMIDSQNERARQMNQVLEQMGSQTRKPIRDRIDPKDNRSLAKRGADFLRSQGFNSCFFYGYLGPLASTYDDDPSGWVGPEEHKPIKDAVHRKNVVLNANLVDAPKQLNGLRGAIRASMGRIRV